MMEVFLKLGVGALLLGVPFGTAEAKGRVFKSDSLKKVAASELPSLVPDGDLEGFKTALRRQIDTCLGQDLGATRAFGSRKATRQLWCVDTNREFLRLAGESRDFAELMAKARSRFEWYQSVGRNGQGEVLFTGYNFPTLRARRTPDEKFRYPIYRRPKDLFQVTENGKRVWRRKNADGSYSPYYSRAEIDSAGALTGRGLEIAYADDLYSVSIFQVQGAGALEILEPNGTTQRLILNYDAQNGHPYVAIGKVLKDRGVEKKFLTIPGMRKYFSEHPGELVEVLNQNPSYVFFRSDSEGPYGVDNIVLTPKHSVALDLGVFPAGVATFLATEKPRFLDGEVAEWVPFTRLAVGQDTGGAIRGAGRVDIYWGEDEEAELSAGHMAKTGSLFIALLPSK